MRLRHVLMYRTKTGQEINQGKGRRVWNGGGGVVVKEGLEWGVGQQDRVHEWEAEDTEDKEEQQIN